MFTYNDPAHCEPHGTSPTKPITHEEIDDTSCEAAKIVNRNDEAGDRIIWVIDDPEKVFVSNNAGEDTLVVAKEDEC